jgi:hypothetical protein
MYVFALKKAVLRGSLKPTRPIRIASTTSATPPDMKIRIANLQEFHYLAAVISIEENPRSLVGKSRSSVDIPLHWIIFFRGDMLHAGAGYITHNARLFLSVSSRPFPATNDVSLLL